MIRTFGSTSWGLSSATALRSEWSGGRSSGLRDLAIDPFSVFLTHNDLGNCAVWVGDREDIAIGVLGAGVVVKLAVPILTIDRSVRDLGGRVFDVPLDLGQVLASPLASEAVASHSCGRRRGLGTTHTRSAALGFLR